MESSERQKMITNCKGLYVSHDDSIDWVHAEDDCGNPLQIQAKEYAGSPAKELLPDEATYNAARIAAVTP